MDLNIALLKHQHNFVLDVKTRFLALVAGYGAGKTKAMAIKAIYLAMLNIGYKGALCSPTNAMAMDSLVPMFSETLEENEIPFTYTRSPYPKFVLHFENGDSEVIIRSAENYKRLAGLNLAWFGVDEADTIETKLAHQMWKLLISRLRAVGAPYVQGFTTSTPEGFGFMFDFWVKDIREKPYLKKHRRIIHASTYDNPFLESDFIQSLLDAYPKNLIEAYLNGQFVNLNTDGCYPGFNDANIIDFYDDTDKVLHIGIDFNVNNMNAIIFCKDDKNLIAIDEIQLKHDKANTYAMVDAIKGKYPNRKILLYPDATGRNRTTNTVDMDNTNHEILRKAGFRLIFDSSGNPPIEDRTTLINMKIVSMGSNITFYVHERCINLINSLRQRQYKNGLPEKDNVTDHGCDCMDYVSWHLFNTAGIVRQYSASLIMDKRRHRRLR